ncbi:hypothetical protein [Desulfovibrio sp. ZJ200]|uniref:hypothetical protein n=1 Tax=Desulfovibrio sp. ZJ200 TaxID=2709792 RepID=UPI0013EC9083|nr:hypothetical protein [Desulfovibrio sp. ZJ200]
MSFQDDVRDEVSSVFLNPDEFGEEINFDGQPVTAIIDDGHGSRATGASGGFSDAGSLGVAEHVRTIYLADSLRERPVPEQQVDIGGESWVVEPEDNAVRVEAGMLILRVSRAYA